VRTLEGDYSSKMRSILKAWSLETKLQSDDRDIWEQLFHVSGIAMGMALNGLIDPKVGEMADLAWHTADVMLSEID
jgi:hypothetical protein